MIFVACTILITIDNSTFIETPDQVENKKCTINPQKKDNKCFQYSIAIFLCHKEIKKKSKKSSTG